MSAERAQGRAQAIHLALDQSFAIFFFENWVGWRVEEFFAKFGWVEAVSRPTPTFAKISHFVLTLPPMGSVCGSEGGAFTDCTGKISCPPRS